jgi:hypothetical protein
MMQTTYFKFNISLPIALPSPYFKLQGTVQRFTRQITRTGLRTLEIQGRGIKTLEILRAR